MKRKRTRKQRLISQFNRPTPCWPMPMTKEEARRLRSIKDRLFRLYIDMGRRRHLEDSPDDPADPYNRLKDGLFYLDHIWEDA